MLKMDFPLLADHLCSSNSGRSRSRIISRKIRFQLVNYSPKPSPRPNLDGRGLLQATRRLQQHLGVRIGELLKQVRSALLEESSEPGSGSEDELPLRYDPDAIAAFFKSRPAEVALRVWFICSQCSLFVFNLLLDKSLGMLQKNETLRAAEFLKLITQLGPTAIKIGQALSIRPDLISAAYLEQLQKLQDKVAPFSNKVAMQIIEREIGEGVFSEISEDPVAAGSLGQVYKARLSSTGDDVAVKVQRPGILRTISCDLLILRQIIWILHRCFRADASFIDLLDSWAIRVFDELDYYKEASNAQRFAKNMSSVPMVVTPEVFMDYTSCQVLTTEWVYGEKLSEIQEGNVISLVKTALTCYLMQLLETGFLHADPHPGNLLRTLDGRLCILDYGLMTEVTEEQQLAMIEYLAHVFNADYPAVAEDLVKLGFLPFNKDSKAVVPEVTQIFTELVRGGGARKLNMKQITDSIMKISQEYTLVIPSYFALIIRAFTLLEGIGLELDPDYTIFQECYPYVAKRLITDDSHRTRRVLKYFLYSSDYKQLNVKRLENMMLSFQDFHRLMSNDSSAKNPESTTKQALLLLLDPQGSVIQELVLSEFVRMADALSRTARLQIWHFYATMFNFPLPSSVIGVTRLSNEDLNALETMQQLWPHVQSYLFSQHSGTALADFTRQMIPLVPELFPGASIFAQKFVLMFLQRQALRYADELSGKSTALAEWDKDPAKFVRRLPWAARNSNADRSVGEAPS